MRNLKVNHFKIITSIPSQELMAIHQLIQTPQSLII